MRILITSDIHLRRWPMRYIGFECTGKQARDTFHPAYLAALLERQIRTKRREAKVSTSPEHRSQCSWCNSLLGTTAGSARRLRNRIGAISQMTSRGW